MLGSDESGAKWAVAIAYFVMLGLNAAGAAGLFGLNIGTVSRMYPTYVTPDGLTFAIWGVIYVLLFLLVLAQATADRNTEQILSRACAFSGLSTRTRIVLAFLLNGVWLPFYIGLYFWVAFIIIDLYLLTLVSLYLSLNPVATPTFWSWLSLSAPIATNASWIVGAWCANLFTAAGESGWKDFYGVAGTPEAATVVTLIVMAIATFVAFALGDIAWPTVAAWALAGLYRMQTVPNPAIFPEEAMSPLIATAARATAIMCGVAAAGAIIIFATKAQQPDPGAHTLLAP
mmetsp:Transcript_127702/g.367547  ORF Transcript_127702/g.367547 Transcript_127702/m.367547 type:complete len:287 (+) Transcript_127702:104-964(+)